MAFKWLREATSNATAAALLRGDLASVQENGDGDGDGGQVTCPTCKGSGKIKGGNVTCPMCHGSGKVDADQAREAETDLASARTAEDVANAACSACGGSGVANGVICDDCNGTGMGGTTGAGDVDLPEVNGDADGGTTDTRLPEVQGPGGKGQVELPEVDGGADPGIQSVPEVGGGTPSSKHTTVPEVTREAQEVMRRMAAMNNSRLREVTIALTGDQLRSLAPETIQALEGAPVLRERNMDPNVGGGVDRDKIPAEDHAGKNRSFPIVTAGDVSDAASSIGRAGSDNYSSDQLKANIIKIAKRKGFAGSLPDAWKNGNGSTKESNDIEGIIRRAVEEATRGVREAMPGQLNQTFDAAPVTRVKNSHGQMGYDITLIREGYGNSTDNRWYPGSAVKELCESGRAEGMQAFANHPTLTEEDDRPERDVKELIGTHTDVHYLEENGVPKAKSVFVPFTTDEHHPQYGWVTTLAEAAAANRSPQPIVGWSLYGVSAGHEGERPDGTEGQVADVILPTSGDMVTNAGAGGEFARRLMMESARRLRRANTPTPQEAPEMVLTKYRNQLAEALKKVREAGTDDERNAALAAVAALEAEASKITLPTAPGSLEELAEAAPALAQSMRETARREVGTTEEELRKQLRETTDKLSQAETVLSNVANVQALAEAVRNAGVEDDIELKHYIGQAQIRGLSDPEDVKDMIETEKAFFARQREAGRSDMQEMLEDFAPGIEGVYSRTPGTDGVDASHDQAVAALRESGITAPIKAAA